MIIEKFFSFDPCIYVKAAKESNILLTVTPRVPLALLFNTPISCFTLFGVRNT